VRTGSIPTDESWVPPAIPDLSVREHDGRCLCLNPAGPAWIVTNREGALLLQLADGTRTVGEIHALLQRSGIGVRLEHIQAMFANAREGQLFESSGGKEADWNARRLAAVHLHLTNRCNLECTYCYRESTPRLPVHHTADHFVDALKAMQPFAADKLTITFTGGEPLMFPGFESVVEASTALGFENLLLTNGILITDERADFIARHFTSITISLDGPTEAIHAATRGRGNHKRVLLGIRRLAEAGADVRVKVTVSPANLQYCHEVSDILPDTVTAQFTPMMPMGRGDELHREFIDNDTFLGLSRGLARATDGRLSNSYVPGQKARRCHAGIFNVSIADTGDVYPCHLFHQDAFKLGNIFTQPFGEVFFGEANHSYVDAMDVEANNDICRSCEVRFLCGGGCKANSLHSTGDFRGVDRYCSYLKASIYDDLFRSVGVEIDTPSTELPNTPMSDAPGTFLGMPSLSSVPQSAGSAAPVSMSTSL
jgi:radical SAM protein with 4Fe4S-binding SPASM domain